MALLCYCCCLQPRLKQVTASKTVAFAACTGCWMERMKQLGILKAFQSQLSQDEQVILNSTHWRGVLILSESFNVSVSSLVSHQIHFKNQLHPLQPCSVCSRQGGQMYQSQTCCTQVFSNHHPGCFLKDYQGWLMIIWVGNREFCWSSTFSISTKLMMLLMIGRGIELVTNIKDFPAK